MRGTTARALSGPRGAVVAFAVDLDRTLLPPGGTSLRAASDLLAIVRKMGLKVVLVSGRAYAPLATFARELPALDALVAENGAVIEAPIGGTVRVVGRRTSEEVRRRLASARWAGVEYGEVVVSVPRPMGPSVRRLLKGLAVGFIPNVDRVMVLPEGVTKASGMRTALRALRLDSRGFAAIGDGENDIDLLRGAEFSGAVENAHPRVRATVDYVCRASFVAGVEEFVSGPLAGYLVARRPTTGFGSPGPLGRPSDAKGRGGPQQRARLPSRRVAPKSGARRP